MKIILLIFSRNVIVVILNSKDVINYQRQCCSVSIVPFKLSYRSRIDIPMIIFHFLICRSYCQLISDFDVLKKVYEDDEEHTS